MKRALSFIAVMALTWSMFDANAQFANYPGVDKAVYKTVNSNPLDQIRQRYLHSSQRRGGSTDILIDYASSNGDDFSLASYMNWHYSQAIDSFGDKYVVVAYDSLHDQITDVGYNYSDFDSIAIDSLFIPFGHEKNTLNTDTLIVKLVQLTAAGYPTNTVLWSQTFTTTGSNSLSGQTDWLAFVLLPLAPGLTVPSTTKFGVRVEYYGAKLDTFGYLFSFVDLGACANYGTTYSADFSAFWPNSYRFNVFNNQLLPTAPPNYGDVYWDCDGDNIGETANPVQNINYVAMIRGIQSSQPCTLTVTASATDETSAGSDGTAIATPSGGTPAYSYAWSNGDNTQTIVGLDAGNYAVTVTDQAGCSATASATVHAASSGGCDTLSNVSSIGAAGFGVYRDINSGGGGYISGHNGFGDISKADVYTNPFANGEIDGAFYLFGVAKYGNANSSITAAVWDNSGAGGSPGNIIASKTVLISDIAQDIADTLPTYVQFIPPAYVSNNDFYVGITFGYGPGDTVALFTDTIGSNTPYGWEEWDPNFGGGWYPYSDPNSWFGGIDIAHAILPVICPANQCPPITVTVAPTNSTCTSSNGSATASASGGSGPYTYQWSNAQTGATALGLAPGGYIVTATDTNNCSGVGSVTVTATNTVLNVNVTPTANTSCSAPNGSAGSAVTNGTAPFSYAWSNGGSTQNISGLAANNYSVSVYDANGCSGTGSAAVGNNLPVITVNTTTTPNSQCLNPNGTATATASGGTGPYTYQWGPATGNQSGATASNLAGGSYSVTATDASGCSGTGSVTVVNNTPNIAVGVTANNPNTTCGTPNGSATVSASGGTAAYTYAWSNGQSGPTISNVGGGNYDVTATDANGCTGTTTVTITSLTPAINVTVNTTANTHCIAPNGTATATASGGSGIFTSYQWGSGQTGASISGLAAGNFTVVVTDDNGCTGTGSGTVTANLPSFTVSTTSVPVTSCTSPNGAASATVNPPFNVTYVWSTVPQQTGPNATNLMAGQYQVTATETTSGCTATANVNIITNPLTIIVSISSINPVTNCIAPNGSATAAASGGAGGFTYAWSNNQTGRTADSLAAGVYNVIATDQNGCTGTNSVTINDQRDTVSVTVNVVNDVTSCSNPNGAVLAVPRPPNGQYTYSWNNGGSSASLNNLPADTYSVTITDNNQCSAAGSATVGTSLNLPTVTASATNETSASANNGTATATASGGTPNYSYSWSNGGSTASISGLDVGNYAVTVTDQAGCTATASATVQTDVGIGDPKNLQSLSLFPNPASDIVNLKLELKEVNQITVRWYNVLGESVIESAKVSTKSFEDRFDVSTLPQGVYMIRIKIGDEEITRRITLIK